MLNSCDESVNWVGILCSAAGHFLPSPLLWFWFLQKITSSFDWWVRQKCKSQNLCTIDWKLKLFNQKTTEFIFYHYSQPFHDVMQKDIATLDFAQGVNFEFLKSLKNNNTEYLLFFDNSCEKICNSKVFLAIATVGRHRGFSTIHIKRNLFRQSKPGWHVELQNMHIVFFKSPGDGMQVSTPSAQMGFRSELIHWYGHAISVPYGHLFVDMSPRPEDQLRCCTNTGSVLKV